MIEQSRSAAKLRVLISVVVVPRQFDAVSALLLPPTAWCRYTTNWVYRLYECGTGVELSDEEFRGINGELQIALHYFRSRGEAIAWLDNDVLQRTELARVSPTGQPS